jgi:hypothetical protein
MAKTVEMTDELDDVIARELRNVVKRPLDEILDELLAETPIHLGSSSADIIRELRGPLPDDDPEFQRNILGRR